MPACTMTFNDIRNIPREHFPLMVLSDNKSSWISWLIKWRTGGKFNHFMWMHKPGKVASQNCFFDEQNIEEYKNNGLKFMWNPDWKHVDRVMLQSQIIADLKKPDWKTRYDVLQILGKALPWAEWLNVPGTRICSDYAAYLKAVDSRYDLYHPAPSEVHRWLNANGYKEYGRYNCG